ncbi:MAG TPA: O-antigen ligase family protein [Candidatus Eisenbacteria bacterium]|nr:O-antigen ligase family protein [Candidatus Eisenbacteria bacterium]
MSETARLAAPSLPGMARIALVVAGVGIALALGVAAGNPTPALLLAAVAAASVAAVSLALVRPFAGVAILAACTTLLVVYDLPGGQGLNLFDLLLPFVFGASVLGSARGEADAADRAVTDPRRLEMTRALRRLERAVIVFYSVAAISILVMIPGGRLESMGNSAIVLLRGMQGLLLFPLGMWWFRSESRIHTTIRSMLVAGILLTILNCVALGSGLVERAGMIWFVNATDHQVAGPNEAASTMYLLIALLLVRQALHVKLMNLVLIGVAAAVLVATASRSGLLAMLVFAAMIMPRARTRWVVFALLAVVAALPFVPEEYWVRIGRTLVLKRGTFEAYTSLIRFYHWQTAIEVFLDHPLIGVGYVGYSGVAGNYGALRIRGMPVDNYYLETAAGMGIVGVVALGFVIVRMFQLGATARRLAPAGTMAAAMARYHTPLWIGLLIINLTGVEFVGMVTLGQIGLWVAMLVRSTHMALESRSA